MIGLARVTGSLARLIGRPGTTSFRELGAVVGEALALRATVALSTDAEIRHAASSRTAAADSGVDPRALAFIAEAARRSLGFEVHREQLLGACALIAGHAIEMDTGEGKTLTGAIAAAYLARGGRRVHVLSINDFLAERDATWMSGLYRSLGVTVGWISQAATRARRADVYARDVVYAAVTEVGYDVLRDRFAMTDAERVSPVFDTAIVDEADAVLIDEAMAPLVLAGTLEQRSGESLTGARAVESLVEGIHYLIDADGATVSFTEAGLDQVENALGGLDLYSGENTEMLTVVNLALQARALLRRDVDYLVRDGAIQLISASRGRVAQLQRWPDGLHAAVEAKEGLAISAQGIVLDTITIQDLALRYDRLSGMSATVVAVAEDLLEFFRLRSGPIPRHRPLVRVDHPPVVFDSAAETMSAVVAAVERVHATGQPVLVGTQSVAESEILARRLRERNIDPQVLNAKNDAAEAAVVSQAGEYGAVTISTQISGRGTDIVLGGVDSEDRERIVALGGLAVVAVGRYPSRRLDAQLRGRSGRQGDPGSTAGFSSLDDELLIAHPPDRLPKRGSEARERLSPRRRSALLSSAQRAAEASRRERHRSTWAFTRAIAWQREFVLRLRDDIAATDVAAERVREAAPDLSAPLSSVPERALRDTLRRIALLSCDEQWTDHLGVLQELRDGIHLRALAGEDPLDAFHTLALAEFDGWEARMYASVLAAVRAMSADDLRRGVLPETIRLPSATWTYMVSDNPLGDAMSRAARSRGRRT
ncbi:accessory Sec system translocase SecA2 [Pseudolysinimonas sp.]|uniref:accessory Sec system translocase SecA2 n=1 Tax=Pseudolysinimonas sp. TaxID=2680009 RepID=UPI0037837BA9